MITVNTTNLVSRKMITVAATNLVLRKMIVATTNLVSRKMITVATTNLVLRKMVPVASRAQRYSRGVMSLITPPCIYFNYQLIECLAECKYFFQLKIINHFKSESCLR